MRTPSSIVAEHATGAVSAPQSLQLIGLAIAFVLGLIFSIRFYSAFHKRVSAPSPKSVASFFEPSELVSRTNFRVWRITFSGLLFVLTVVAVVSITSSKLLDPSDKILEQLVSPSEKNLVDSLYNVFDADKTPLVIFFVLLVIVGYPYFSKISRIMIRVAHQVMQFDEIADAYSREVADGMVAGNNGSSDVVDIVSKKWSSNEWMYVPRELNKEDTIVRLQYLVLLKASASVPSKGLLASIDEVKDGCSSGVKPLDIAMLGLGLIFYVAAAMALVFLLPLVAQNGDRCNPTVYIPWWGISENWVQASLPGWKDLSISVAQYSVVVVAPFIIGVNRYDAIKGVGAKSDAETKNEEQKDKLKNEEQKKVKRLIASLLQISLASASVVLVSEAIRFVFEGSSCQPNTPVDAARLPLFLVANGVLLFYLSTMPILLLCIWIRCQMSNEYLRVVYVAVASFLCEIALMCLFEYIEAAGSVPPPSPDDTVRFELLYSALSGFLIAAAGIAKVLFATPDSAAQAGSGSQESTGRHPQVDHRRAVGFGQRTPIPANNPPSTR